MRITLCVFALMALTLAAPVRAADRWYDTNSSPGLQTGNNSWSTGQTRWNTVISPLGDGRISWSNTGDNAIFQDNSSFDYTIDGLSLVTVSGTVEVNAITFNGTGHTVQGTTLTLTGSTITTNVLGTINAPLGGSADLTKLGSSALILGGSNSYTGTTSINQGTLALSGAYTNNISTSSTISVASGALLDVTGLTGGSGGSLSLAGTQTLRGGGAVNGGVNAPSGSTIAPGTSTGQLTFNGANNITLNTGATLEIEIGADTTPGGTYDQVIVDRVGVGKVFSPGNATLKLIGVPGVTTGVAYTIIDATNSATIDGSFFRNVGGAPLDTEGFAYSQGGMSFTIDYDSSFVSVTFSAVPEPGTGLLAVGGIALYLRRARRRRTA